MTPRYPESPDAPWALLARHLAGEASAAERAALRAWVRADPDHLQLLTTVTRAWERAGEAAAQPVLFSPDDVEQAWQRFRPLMVVAPQPATAVPPPAVSRPLWPRQTWVRALAAGLALLLLIGGGWVAVRLPARPETVATYVSTNSRRLIRLPDGSRVWLNARSQLRYRGRTALLGPSRRAVRLTGEAYFEVRPDPARPFLVTTTTARVRVTGTAFNVRAYAAEDSVEVSVTHGRVWLARRAAADSVLLTARTRAALHAADAPGRVVRPLRARAQADPNFRAWQTDTLRFRDAPVAEVARALRATFGTRLRLADPALAHCRFTGTFARAQPAQVLAVLAAATLSRLTSDEHGGYVLAGAGCAPAPASRPSAAGQSTAPRP